MSSWSTWGIGILDLLNSLLVAKQMLKLWPEKDFEWQQTSFLFFKNRTLFIAISSTYPGKLHDFFFDTEYKIVASMSNVFFILCYSDVVLLHIYISICLHSFYNTFFSAFFSKQIYIMVGCSLTHPQAVYRWKLSYKKKHQQQQQRWKQFKLIVVRTLFLAQLIPSVNFSKHILCGVLFYCLSDWLPAKVTPITTVVKYKMYYCFLCYPFVKPLVR